MAVPSPQRVGFFLLQQGQRQPPHDKFDFALTLSNSLTPCQEIWN